MIEECVARIARASNAGSTRAFPPCAPSTEFWCYEQPTGACFLLGAACYLSVTNEQRRHANMCGNRLKPFDLAEKAVAEPDKKKDDTSKRLPSTERYLEYGETAVKLGLMIVGVELGGSFAVFMLAVTIIVTLRMLGDQSMMRQMQPAQAPRRIAGAGAFTGCHFACPGYVLKPPQQFTVAARFEMPPGKASDHPAPACSQAVAADC